MPQTATFADDVKDRDRARYLATLFAPEAKRGDLFVLHAFDLEMKRIPFMVKESAMGEIRLQWWQEVLEGARAGEASGHPLASAMLDLIERHALPQSAFERYFDASSFAFYHDAFADRSALESWAGATCSSIIQMSAIILDPDTAKLSADASGHAGVAIAVSNIVRNLLRTRLAGQCYLPEDMLSACGLSREDFVSGNDKPGLKRATDALAAFGLEHLKRAKGFAANLPSALKPAYLTLGSAAAILAKASRPGSSPAVDEIRSSALSTYVSIIRATF